MRGNKTKRSARTRRICIPASFMQLLLLLASVTFSVNALAQSQIVNPSAGSTLSDSAQKFSWTIDSADVERVWLYVGTTEGGRDITDSGDLRLDTEYDVIGIPVDGSTIHARLWYYIATRWFYIDSSFTAADIEVEISTPAIDSPVNNSELTSASVEFKWTDNNTLVNYWWLYLGSAKGAKDIYDSGRALRNRSSVTVDELPVDGSPVHARLWFRTTANGWEYADTIYRANDGSTDGPYDFIEPADIVGRYETLTPAIDADIGFIQHDGDTYRWIDGGGKTQVLTLDSTAGRLLVADSPAGSVDGFSIVLKENAETGMFDEQVAGLISQTQSLERISSDFGVPYNSFTESLGVTDTTAFIDAHGGRQAFSEKTLYLAESFLKAEQLYYRGDYAEAKVIIDEIWELYPPAVASAWYNDQQVPDGVFLGLPAVYAPIRMLDVALQSRLANEGIESSYTFMITVVEASCIQGIMPSTQAELDAGEGEFVTRYRNPQSDDRYYRQSFRLFGEYLRAMTKGAFDYDLQVVTLDESLCFEGQVSGIFAGTTQWAKIVGSIDPAIFDSSDMFVSIHPAFVPDSEELGSRGYITGGASQVRKGFPVLIANDFAFMNNEGTSDPEEWTDMKRRVYLPRWVQHEYFHILYRIFTEYGFEETDHMWFDRSTWPDDFVGFHEIDYYHESVTKRLMDASPSIAERLSFAEYGPEVSWQSVTTEMLAGRYRTTSATNDSHSGELVYVSEENMNWVNDAGTTVPYVLNKEEGRLDSTDGSGRRWDFMAARDSAGTIIEGQVAGFYHGTHLFIPEL